MKPFFYSTVFGLAALCSSSTAAPPLKAELLEPTEPVRLVPADVAIAKKAAAALEEQQRIENSWKDDPHGKRDFDKLRALQEDIRNGQAVKQGITLTLRLTNTSTETVTISYGGDTSTNFLTVTGPGAHNLKFSGPMTREYRQGKRTEIAPGKSVDFPLEELRYGERDSSRWLLSAPGEYAIKLAFRTHLGQEPLRIESNTVTLEVLK